MTTERMSAFARRLGVDRSHVTRLRQAGRLVMSAGGKRVEVEASLARIEATRDPRRDDLRNKFAAQRDARRTVESDKLKVESLEPSTTNTQPPTDPGPRTPDPAAASDSAAAVTRAARVEKMHFDARLATVRVAKLQGKLADVETIKRLAANDGATLRSQLENLADQAAPRLAPVRDPAEAGRIFGALLDDVTQTMEQLLEKNIDALRAEAQGAAGNQ
jgi:hypothetical protein